MGSILSWAADEDRREREESKSYKDLQFRKSEYLRLMNNKMPDGISIKDAKFLLEYPTRNTYSDDDWFYSECRIKRIKSILGEK